MEICDKRKADMKVTACNRRRKNLLHLLFGEYLIETEYGKAYDEAPGEYYKYPSAERHILPALFFLYQDIFTIAANTINIAIRNNLEANIKGLSA